MHDGIGGIRYPHDTPPEHGDAIEIADGVLWMRLPLPMALDHVNIYALDDGDSWTIVDTGFDSRKSRAIWDRLLSGPLHGKPVGRLIVTHHHPDHVGLAGRFVQRGAQLCMPRTAFLLSRMLTMDEQPTYPEETLAFYRRNGMSSEVYEKRKSERPFNFADCVHPMPLGYTRLIDGQEMTFGGRTWTVRMGNGHAPEHATFWSNDDDLVLGGDQLLPSISPNIGVYPTEPDADPLADWLTSCRYFQQFATDQHFVLGGHKLPFRGLSLRLKQLIDNHANALDRLYEHLSTPRIGGECFAPLFKREIGPEVYGLAFVETIAHLNHLHQSGRAERHLNNDGVFVWKQAR